MLAHELLWRYDTLCCDTSDTARRSLRRRWSYPQYAWPHGACFLIRSSYLRDSVGRWEALSRRSQCIRQESMIEPSSGGWRVKSISAQQSIVSLLWASSVDGGLFILIEGGLVPKMNKRYITYEASGGTSSEWSCNRHSMAELWYFFWVTMQPTLNGWAVVLPLSGYVVSPPCESRPCADDRPCVEDHVTQWLNHSTSSEWLCGLSSLWEPGLVPMTGLVPRTMQPTLNSWTIVLPLSGIRFPLFMRVRSCTESHAPDTRWLNHGTSSGYVRDHLNHVSWTIIC